MNQVLGGEELQVSGRQVAAQETASNSAGWRGFTLGVSAALR